MRNRHPQQTSILQLAAVLATAALAALPAASAAPVAPETAAAVLGADAFAGGQAVRLDEVEVFSSKTSAITQAPTDSKIDALEPTTVISAQTLNNQIVPTADYATIVNIAPSVANVATQGPGLSEAKMTQMRGFADGQYNVTYDGIPFGDANGATHHTTSYFPAKVLGGIVIDRGPGTAADIGQNTFGGSINLLSKDPRPDQAAVLTLSDGSWNTFLGNIEINTGNLPQAHGGSLVTTYQYMSTDGYRSFSYMQRNTYFLKYLQPLGANTTLTVVGNYNNIKFNNPGAVTQAQINQFGRNYGLDNNPFDPNNNYYPYNYQAKQADFDYVGLDTKLPGDIAVHDKAYTYYYNNDSHEKPADPVVGSTTKFPGTTALQAANGVNPYTNNSANTLAGTTNASNDDPGGQIKVNAYRAFGDYLAVTHGEDSPLEEKVGIWAEYQRAVRYDYALDYSPAYLAANPQYNTRFGAFDPSTGVKANTFKPGYQWFMHVYNKTFQPYAEVIWKPIPNLTIDAGVKDSNFTIDLEAPLNQGTESPDFTNNTYKNWEPHFEANYLLTPHWSAYFQWAQGMAFPIVTDEQNVPNDAKDIAAGASPFNPANLKQEKTTNYQIGTVYKTDRFNGDFDAYLIDITNLVSSVADPNDSTNTLAFQSKGAWVSGLEAEGTLYVGGGFSLFANGSINKAVYKTNAGVPRFPVGTLGAFDSGGGVPSGTANVGVVFNREGWFASASDKYIGDFVVYQSSLTNPDLGLNGQTSTGFAGGAPVTVRSNMNPSYSLLSLAGGYAWKLPQGGWVHSVKFKLQIDNALDRRVQVLNGVGATAAADTFNVLPTTDYFFTVSTEF